MEQRHSGFGVSSFIISIIVGALIFFVFVIAGVMEAKTPGGINENSLDAIVIGALLLLFLALDVLAAGLGIAGLFQRDRKKSLSILGLVFSATTIFSAGVVLLIGGLA